MRKDYLRGVICKIDEIISGNDLKQEKFYSESFASTSFLMDDKLSDISKFKDHLKNIINTDKQEIIKSLNLGVETLRSGEKESDNIIKKIRDYLADYNLIQIEYVSIRDVNNFEKVNKIDEDIVILISVFIGKIRLIDNLIYRKKNG